MKKTATVGASKNPIPSLPPRKTATVFAGREFDAFGLFRGARLEGHFCSGARHIQKSLASRMFRHRLPAWPTLDKSLMGEGEGVHAATSSPFDVGSRPTSDTETLMYRASFCLISG